jgi:site-specific DNA recombinase
MMNNSTSNRSDHRDDETIKHGRVSERAGIYARVSSDQQVEQQTIQSQISDLRERVEADGHSLPEQLCFLDDGISGATLTRPALEKLRDIAYAGGLQKLYVHSPDRLARKYAWQVLLVDELHSHGVEIVFLNHTMGASPEEDLLLQMEGMFAEYERAKILERSRRGKRHAAQRGSVSVLSNAPYGYRYIKKQEGNGTAAYEVIEEQAAVVKQIFEWVGCDRCSIGEVSRRLKKKGVRTATGKTWWDRATVWGMLKNTAYMGSAAFGKTRTGDRRKRLMPQRGHSKTPRRTGSTYDTPKEDWLFIPVPAIVDEGLFETVQEQLDTNRQQASERKRGARYLLQGLVKCSCCGYAYYGKKVSRSSAKGKVAWAYYRCVGTDAYRFGGQRVCDNKQVRTDKLDEAVWNDVCELLRDPNLLKEEYERRLTSSDEPSSQRTSLTKQVEQSRRTINRLIDAYSDGVISREEFDPRIERVRTQLTQREEGLAQTHAAAAEREALKDSLHCLETFASQIEGGLADADWNTRREILRTAIDHIQVEPAQIRITYRINFPLFLNRKKSSKSLLFRWRRAVTASRLENHSQFCPIGRHTSDDFTLLRLRSQTEVAKIEDFARPRPTQLSFWTVASNNAKASGVVWTQTSVTRSFAAKLRIFSNVFGKPSLLA